LLQHPSQSQQAASGVRQVMLASCKVTQGVGGTWATCPTLHCKVFEFGAEGHGFVVEVDVQLLKTTSRAAGWAALVYSKGVHNCRVPYEALASIPRVQSQIIRPPSIPCQANWLQGRGEINAG